MKAITKIAACMSLFVISIFTGISLSARELSSSSAPSELRDFVARQTKIRDPSPKQLIELANACAWLGDYREGVRAMDRLIKVRPDDFNAYSYRGVLKRSAGLYAAAESDFNKAEMLGDTSTSLYGNRMRVRLALNKFSDASKDADVYLQRKPNNAHAYFVKGMAASESGQLESSLGLLSKAIELDPVHAAYVQARGVVLEKLGRKKDAESDFLKAKSLGWK